MKAIIFVCFAFFPSCCSKKHFRAIRSRLPQNHLIFRFNACEYAVYGFGIFWASTKDIHLFQLVYKSHICNIKRVSVSEISAWLYTFRYASKRFISPVCHIYYMIYWNALCHTSIVLSTILTCAQIGIVICATMLRLTLPSHKWSTLLDFFGFLSIFQKLAKFILWIHAYESNANWKFLSTSISSKKIFSFCINLPSNKLEFIH